MRHRISGKILSRTHHQRQALLKSLARALFTHGSIKTTEAKSKAVIPLIAKICRWAQKTDLVSRRRIFALFQDRKLTNKIVTAVNQAFADRQSNFTITKRFKKRQGDDALIVKLQFTKPYNLNPAPKVEKTTKKTALKKIVKTVKKTKAKTNEK